MPVSDPQPGFRIGSIHAWVAVGPDDEEGIAGFLGPDGMLPMIAADQRRLNALRPMAELLAATGTTVRLVRFDRRTELDCIPGRTS